MTADPPRRWHAHGWGRALAAAEALSAAWAAGAPLPEGWAVVKDRPMRAVFRGEAVGPLGPTQVVAKVRRPATALDRARERLRRPRGPAEGVLLSSLAEHGVRVPAVLAWSGEAGGAFDLLLLRAVEGATDLGAWLRGPRSRAERRTMAEALGRLLRAAHDAGWIDRDVHRGNLLVDADGPVLLDPGAAALRGPLSPMARVLALAYAGHGLAADARSGLAALRAYHAGDRAAAREWLPVVARRARAVARAYRRGRARRAHRTGRHFEAFGLPEAHGRGVRNADRTPRSWRELAASLLARDPEGAVPLKAGGAVLRATLPGLAEPLVLKRFAATWRDRLRPPRALRAFRRAYALRVRGVGCPEPLLAACDGSGAGFVVSAAVGGEGGTDLHRATRPDATGTAPIDRLPGPARRAALHRLGRFLRRLHDAEVSHRDLKAPNLVAHQGADGVWYAVVDLEGVRPAWRPVSWAVRARDLARLDASVGSPPVSRADRLRVLKGYFAAFERLPVRLGAFARRVAALSARKRGPSGAPR